MLTKHQIQMTLFSLGKQVERVAIEFNQMQHLVGRGKDLPFMKENEWVSKQNMRT